MTTPAVPRVTYASIGTDFTPVHDLLDARKYDLAVACLLEVGKSRLEAVGEAEEAVDLVRYYCREMERGVFGVIAPFNLPLALSTNMVSGALLTGNTVVYKPSPMAGLTGALLVATLHEAGVAFTGSHAVGMEILRAMVAGRYARPALLETAAEGVMRSAFGLQGQKCSACSTVFVEDRVYDAFLARLAERSRGLIVGNPEERRVFMGPVIDDRAARRFETASREAREEIFLPFLTVRRFDRLGSAIAEDHAEIETVLETAEAGVLIREPSQRGDDRGVARRAELRRVEGLRRHRQGRPRPLLPAAVHAGAEPDGDAEGLSVPARIVPAAGLLPW